MSTDNETIIFNNEETEVKDNLAEQEIFNKFYENARDYWSKVPATVDGMLGGFGFISEKDLHGSRQFLYSLFNLTDPPEKKLALDCGAGIGRITKNLLIPIFERVDMIDQNPDFIKSSNKYIGRLMLKVRKQFSLGLQDFVPEKGCYDVIWCQWVLGHLKDDDLIQFFKYCSNGIKQNGVIIVKENVTSSDQVEIDQVDSSVTRPEKVLLEIFEKANLNCIKHIRQTNFPKGLYSVHMFALRMKNCSATASHNTDHAKNPIEQLNKEFTNVIID